MLNMTLFSVLHVCASEEYKLCLFPLQASTSAVWRWLELAPLSGVLVSGVTPKTMKIAICIYCARYLPAFVRSTLFNPHDRCFRRLPLRFRLKVC